MKNPTESKQITLSYDTLPEYDQNSAIQTLPNLIPYNYPNSLATIYQGLKLFGLSYNESKVLIHLAQHGKRSSPQISKALKIPRTETYQILKNLQIKGLIFSNLGHPKRFEAMKFDLLLSFLLKKEKQKLKDLEIKKENLINTWKTFPDFGSVTSEIREKKFQVIRGKIPILNKFKVLLESSRQSVRMAGSEEDYLKLYNENFPKFLKNSKAEMKILTTGPKGLEFLFDGIPHESIRQMDLNPKINIFFLIVDEKEGLLFLNNTQKNDFVALSTDSSILLSSLRIVFDNFWSRGNYFSKEERKKHLELENQNFSNIEEKILEFLNERYPDLNLIFLKEKLI